MKPPTSSHNTMFPPRNSYSRIPATATPTTTKPGISLSRMLPMRITTCKEIRGASKLILRHYLPATKIQKKNNATSVKSESNSQSMTQNASFNNHMICNPNGNYNGNVKPSVVIGYNSPTIKFIPKPATTQPCFKSIRDDTVTYYPAKLSCMSSVTLNGGIKSTPDAKVQQLKTTGSNQTRKIIIRTIPRASPALVNLLRPNNGKLSTQIKTSTGAIPTETELRDYTVDDYDENVSEIFRYYDNFRRGPDVNLELYRRYDTHVDVYDTLWNLCEKGSHFMEMRQCKLCYKWGPHEGFNMHFMLAHARMSFDEIYQDKLI